MEKQSAKHTGNIKQMANLTSVIPTILLDVSRFIEKQCESSKAKMKENNSTEILVHFNNPLAISEINKMIKNQ